MRFRLRHKRGAQKTPARSRNGKRYRALGASLGLPNSRPNKLIEEIQAGLPFHAIKSLCHTSGISMLEMASTLDIPERTLARRRIAGRFSQYESERLLRVCQIFDKAVGLFEGDAKAAVTWLTTPKRALRQKTPLDYARTELGARQVEDLIGSLEHGAFA